MFLMFARQYKIQAKATSSCKQNYLVQIKFNYKIAK